MTEEPLYPPIHSSRGGHRGGDHPPRHGLRQATTRSSTASTPQGGTHQTALRAAVAKTVKEFYHKDYDPSDIRTSIIAAISIKVSNPVFENQMKTKYGSKEVEPGVSVNNFVADFLTKHLDDYLHKHAETAQVLRKRSSRTRRSARRSRASRRRPARRQEGEPEQQETARLQDPPHGRTGWPNSR